MSGRGTEAFGFPTALWTCRRVAQVFIPCSGARRHLARPAAAALVKVRVVFHSHLMPGPS